VGDDPGSTPPGTLAAIIPSIGDSESTNAYDDLMHRHRESRRPTWPNPVRTPLLFLAGLIAVYGYHHWVGGTGGLDPVLMEPQSRDASTWISVPIHTFFIRHLALPSLVLFGAGLLAGIIWAGPADAGAGLRYALGSSKPRWMPGAARFLAIAARVAAWGGILLGITACAVMEIVSYRVFRLDHFMGNDPYADLIWPAWRWALFAPLAGIILGRVVFGALAAGARIRSGEPDAPVFSDTQDVALVGLFGIPWYFVYFMTWEPW
jgi:hypothetical protein